MCLTSPHRALHADYMLVNLGVVKSQFNQLKKKKKNVYRDREGGKKTKKTKGQQTNPHWSGAQSSSILPQKTKHY